MKRITLIIGGYKSGTSRYALDAANRKTGAKKIFIATAEPSDDEMKQRIDRHRKERGSDWTTVEAPLHLAEAIDTNGTGGAMLVVDCLTLWLNNLLMATPDKRVIDAKISEMITTLAQTDGFIYLVSNEVGCGIVPENRLARRFRDLAGVVNQEVASLSDRVVWMVAGIPVTVK